MFHFYPALISRDNAIKHLLECSLAYTLFSSYMSSKVDSKWKDSLWEEAILQSNLCCLLPSKDSALDRQIYKYTNANFNYRWTNAFTSDLIIEYLGYISILPELWLWSMQANYIISFSSHRWPVISNKASKSTYVNRSNSIINNLFYVAWLLQTRYIC